MEALAVFAISVISATISGLALVFTLLNVLTWPRKTRATTRVESVRQRRVSVLIPARNEERDLPATLEALRPTLPLAHELIVFSDASTDRTDAIVEDFAAEFPNVRLVKGDGLPEGWVGKPHACHQLSRHASGDTLLFVDADVQLRPGALSEILGLMDEHDAACLSAVPRQVTGTWFEALVLPLLHLTYVSWFPLILTRRSADARFLAANGQVLAVERAAYDAIGGFEAVRREVVDDMAFCRRMKESGRGVLFADGDGIASCRMYHGAHEVWQGFSKNLYEGIGGNALALAFVLTLYTAGFILPWLAIVPAGMTLGCGSTWLDATSALLFGGAFGANLLQRGIMALRYHHRALSIALHPLAVLILLAIAINSLIWSARGTITWAGRHYVKRQER